MQDCLLKLVGNQKICCWMSFENFYYLFKNDNKNINSYIYHVCNTTFASHKSILYTLQYPRVAANNTGGVDPGTVPGSAFLD